MRHLALPFYCAFIVGLMLALLARAIYTGAHSFVLVALVGIGYFGWACVRDLRTSWPAFRDETSQRAAARERMPLPAEDTH
ncbi:hypothetical protein [Stenotrophomonas maltophilia]|uniref:hypothetical protein n=1 Tax=Stenotrophomonas maltophilia TaxID=40324 RepID=UPI00201D264D|nr:hypothetical protein [Stenotrophomonas maltophilia]UQY95367.1 hypothetical protein LZ605_19980 [Stenotrophomonas maltophilia]